MAFPSDIATNSQVCTVTTEHFVYDPNPAVVGTYLYYVDLNAAVDGDVFELRVYQMVRTAGTARVTYFTTYYGAQPSHDLIKVSIPIVNTLTDASAIRFSLKQTFGTTRTIPWRITQIQ